MISRRLFLASIRFSITIASSTVSLFLAVPGLGPVQVVHAPCDQNPNSRSMNAPTLRCRPLLVSGMPMVRETLDLKTETPRNLQMEKPPRFIASSQHKSGESCNPSSSPLLSMLR